MSERIKEYEERARECLSFNLKQLTEALATDTLETWVDEQLSVGEPDDPNSDGHDILITYGGPTVYLDTGTALFHYHENGFDDYTLPIDRQLADKLEELAKEVSA